VAYEYLTLEAKSVTLMNAIQLTSTKELLSAMTRDLLMLYLVLMYTDWESDFLIQVARRIKVEIVPPWLGFLQNALDYPLAILQARHEVRNGDCCFVTAVESVFGMDAQSGYPALGACTDQAPG